MIKTLGRNSRGGFTLVELLIVIVVIAILAAITVVAYGSIQQRARQSVVTANLSTSATLMAKYRVLSEAYPSNETDIENGKGLPKDDHTTYSFHSDGNSYCITATSTYSNVGPFYLTSSTGLVAQGSCPEDSGVVVATLAGNGTNGYANGTGTGAVLSGPAGLVASGGTLYFTDGGSSRVRTSTLGGDVTTLAGNGGSSYAEGTGTSALFQWPQAISVGGGGLLYVTDTNNQRVRSVTTGGTTALIAGSSQGHVEGTGSAAKFNVPRGIIYNPIDGVIYIADTQNNMIRSVTTSGVTAIYAGSTTGSFADSTTKTSARFNYPQGLAVDGSGNIYVADTYNNRIRKISSAGVTTVAVTGTAGHVDGTAAAAQFYNPGALTLDSDGNIYVADTGGNYIRKISTSGQVTTIAGDGTAGFKDGAASSSEFSSPHGLVILNNVLYVADTGNNRLRTISGL